LEEPDTDLVAVFRALSVRNQAIGVLIDRGNDPDEACVELYRRANREGVTMNETAQDILDTLTVPVMPNLGDRRRRSDLPERPDRRLEPD
jgi:hypothetical protein